MSVRFGLIFLLLALAAVAESSMLANSTAWMDGIADLNGGEDFEGLVVGDMVDTAEESMMESETSRRMLWRRRWISYGALRRDRVPCSRRGRSYYSCGRSRRYNVYRRGCSAITRCARYSY